MQCIVPPQFSGDQNVDFAHRNSLGGAVPLQFSGDQNSQGLTALPHRISQDKHREILTNRTVELLAEIKNSERRKRRNGLTTLPGADLAGFSVPAAQCLRLSYPRVQDTRRGSFWPCPEDSNAKEPPLFR